MENREELYDRTPFYMTYPIQNLYLAEMEYEKDMERMKELYPRDVQQLMRLVEQRCDEMEYEGSRMYDENPDRAMMEEEARRLYERFLRENPQFGNMASPQPSMPMPQPGMPMPQPGMPMPQPGMPMPQPGMPMQRPGMPGRFPLMPPEEFRDMIEEPMPMREEAREELSAQNRREDRDSWLRSLIQIIFNDEVYRRRCRNRRCRRWSM